MNIGICPDECRLFYQVRLPFLTHHIFQRLALNWSRMCFTKWKAVPISSELAWKYLSWSMPHKTLRLRCNISLHKMCYPVFWANLQNSGSSKACCLFDHIWSRLPYQDQPNLHPNLLFARVHHHRSCLWCWEPQAWYTSSTTCDKQKHCPEWLIL